MTSCVVQISTIKNESIWENTWKCQKGQREAIIDIRQQHTMPEPKGEKN